ncbi:MAG: hypothetical protein GX141_05740 [Armatimonadetes bacterium]|nr:hypothetical protein [Armatimonadota bacterium]
MMDCCGIQDQLSAYVDGELSKSDLIDVELHLSSCAECRAELAALEMLVRATVKLEEVDPPSSLRSRIAAATTQRRKVDRWAAVVQRVISVRRIAWAGAIAGAAAAAVLFIGLGNVGIDEPIKQSAAKSPLSGPISTPVTKQVAVEPLAVEPSPVVAMETAPRRVQRSVTVKATKKTTIVALAPKPTIPAVIKKTEPVVVETHSPQPQPDNIVMDDTTHAQEVVAITVNGPKLEAENTNTKSKQNEQSRIASSPAVSNDNAEQWIEEMKIEAAMHRKGRHSNVVSVINARF